MSAIDVTINAPVKVVAVAVGHRVINGKKGGNNVLSLKKLWNWLEITGFSKMGSESFTTSTSHVHTANFKYVRGYGAE